MKKAAILVLGMVLGLNILAQSPQSSIFSEMKNNGNWFKLNSDARISPDEFFIDYAALLGLGEKDHFELIHMTEDELGFSHHRFQQYFNGYPVEGAQYILHATDGYVRHGNGKLVKGLTLQNPPRLSATQSISEAQTHIGADKYYWEIEEMERRIKMISKDPTATFYPDPELVICDPLFQADGSDYLLAWKVDLFADGPQGRKILYIAAETGNVLLELDGCTDGSVEGIAETRHHGTQIIITDSISPTEYRLRDYTRGGGIETYDMNELEDETQAVDFVDDDNYWDNVNPEEDEVATDVHWGMEMTYDYFLHEHGRDSYDDNGAVIVSYVHHDTAWRNAQWTGMWARFGDGTDQRFTGVNVVAHELAHGVTGNSAKLIYRNESGALNESFSDIFGTTVEFFALPAQANWLLDAVGAGAIRSMSNPNDFDDPDTYKGDFWATGPADNGGVHTNSGVQNFWFYLLSAGGSGTNDNGDFYQVDSIGMDKAADIAYRNLVHYLTESSNYVDARLGSLQAAEDLFGPCSHEVIQVMHAWYAVGVGTDTITNDVQSLEVLTPVSSCISGGEEQVTFTFRNNRTGCGHVLNAGDSILLGYQVDNRDPVEEYLVLPSTMEGGDTMTYTFRTPLDPSVNGAYELTIWTNVDGDLFVVNDLIWKHPVSKSLWLESPGGVTFEYGPSEDSFYVETNAHSEVAILITAANESFRGLRMNSFGITPENSVISPSEEENFNLNPDFQAKLCMCVDATTWSNVLLNFDLRQTLARFYADSLHLDLAYSIALRVLVDGEQIGEQFHPATHEDDPYTTQTLSLDDYAGRTFELCFQGVHGLNADEDINDGPGDNSFLDNILLSDQVTTSVNNPYDPNIQIYPNPSSGQLVVELNGVESHDIRIFDPLGRTVYQRVRQSNNDALKLDLSSLTSGMYFISIKSEAMHFTEVIELH